MSMKQAMGMGMMGGGMMGGGAGPVSGSMGGQPGLTSGISLPIPAQAQVDPQAAAGVPANTAGVMQAAQQNPDLPQPGAMGGATSAEGAAEDPNNPGQPGAAQGMQPMGGQPGSWQPNAQGSMLYSNAAGGPVTGQVPSTAQAPKLAHEVVGGDLAASPAGGLVFRTTPGGRSTEPFSQPTALKRAMDALGMVDLQRRATRAAEDGQDGQDNAAGEQMATPPPAANFAENTGPPRVDKIANLDKIAMGRFFSGLTRLAGGGLQRGGNLAMGKASPMSGRFMMGRGLGQIGSGLRQVGTRGGNRFTRMGLQQGGQQFAEGAGVFAQQHPQLMRAMRAAGYGTAGAGAAHGLMKRSNLTRSAVGESGLQMNLAPWSSFGEDVFDELDTWKGSGKGVGSKGTTGTKIGDSIAANNDALSATAQAFYDQCVKKGCTELEIFHAVKEASTLDPQIAEDLAPLLKEGNLGRLFGRMSRGAGRRGFTPAAPRGATASPARFSTKTPQPARMGARMGMSASGTARAATRPPVTQPGRFDTPGFAATRRTVGDFRRGFSGQTGAPRPGATGPTPHTGASRAGQAVRTGVTSPAGGALGGLGLGAGMDTAEEMTGYNLLTGEGGEDINWTGIMPMLGGGYGALRGAGRSGLMGPRMRAGTHPQWERLSRISRSRPGRLAMGAPVGAGGVLAGVAAPMYAAHLSGMDRQSDMNQRMAEIIGQKYPQSLIDEVGLEELWRREAEADPSLLNQYGMQMAGEQLPGTAEALVQSFANNPQATIEVLPEEQQAQVAGVVRDMLPENLLPEGFDQMAPPEQFLSVITLGKDFGTQLRENQDKLSDFGQRVGPLAQQYASMMTEQFGLSTEKIREAAIMLQSDDFATQQQGFDLLMSGAPEIAAEGAEVSEGGNWLAQLTGMIWPDNPLQGWFESLNGWQAAAITAGAGLGLFGMFEMLSGDDGFGPMAAGGALGALGMMGPSLFGNQDATPEGWTEGNTMPVPPAPEAAPGLGVNQPAIPGTEDQPGLGSGGMNELQRANPQPMQASRFGPQAVPG